MLRFLWFEPLFRSQCTAVGPGLVIEHLPFIQGNGRIILGEDVRLSGKPSFGFLNRWDDAPEQIIGDHYFLTSSSRGTRPGLSRAWLRREWNGRGLPVSSISP